jgi:uncharacterized membrane protein
MECPACKKVIKSPSKKCIHCGYIYSDEIYTKLSLYFDLKNELERVRLSIKSDVWVRLQKISTKFDTYEKIINDELNNLVVPPVEEITSKPLDKPIEKPKKEEVKKPPTAPQEISKKEKVSISKPKEATPRFEVRLGQKWLLIIGIITMVFGIGYFLKYSFDKGWIGPAGRVAMAYLWGIALLISGNQFRKKFKVFGLYLIGGGIATLYFSTFAAFQIYDLFPQTPSFIIMVIITIFASSLSIIYDTKWLAVLGLIGGFLTPIMLSTGQDNQIVLMTYMTILNLGLLGIAFYKRWYLLNALGFIFTYLLYSAWFAKYYAESKFWPAIIFLNIFYLIYSVMPFVYQFLKMNGEKLKGFLIITPNSFIAFGFSYFMIRNYFSLEWVSVITISYAVVFLLMASYLYLESKQEHDAFAVLAAKSALFLIITIPVIFSKHWITIFWAAQAVTILWMGIKLDKKILSQGAYLLLVITIGKFLFYDYSTVFRFSIASLSIKDAYTYLFVERYITSILLLSILYAFAYLARKYYLGGLSSFSNISVPHDSSVILGVMGILLFVILNVETSSFFHDYLPAARFAAISVLWTVFSVMLMVKGFRDKNSLLRKVSLGLFLLTLIKVFLFDMAKISTPYRIISFIILGIMLVGTSYLYYKFKDRIIEAISEDSKKRETSS